MTLGTHTVITGHKVKDESSIGEHRPSTRKKMSTKGNMHSAQSIYKTTKV